LAVLKAPIVQLQCYLLPYTSSQDFVWGALFFPEKFDDLFSRHPQNTLKLRKMLK